MPVLKRVIKYLAKSKKKLWLWFDAFNDDSLYVLSTTDVLQKYIDFKVDDIEEFAAIYTYERHDVMGSLDDRESKEKMYEEVHQILLALKEKGALNR
jgi:hypothetical protein